MLTAKKIFSTIWDYVVVSFGTLLFCLAWDTFLIPNGIAAGGLTGACTVIQFATQGYIPVAYSYFIANTILLIIGVIALGNAFGVKTVYAVLLSSSRSFRILSGSRQFPAISSTLRTALWSR